MTTPEGSLGSELRSCTVLEPIDADTAAIPTGFHISKSGGYLHIPAISGQLARFSDERTHLRT